MSRYIDIDDAIEIVTKTQGMWATTLHALYDAPRIDIVRCKECKWYDNGQNESDSWNYCTRHFEYYIDVNDDDFCSYGERSDT